MNEDDPDFEGLFHAEFPSVVRTVFLICRDHERAEDLAQDAFVELLRHWEPVSRYERPGAWVRRVAIRLAIRSARREQLRSLVERRAAQSSPESAEPNSGLLNAVRELPPQQRAVVALYYYEDLPVEEVSAMIGCSPATVRVHLHRARGALARRVVERERE